MLANASILLLLVGTAFWWPVQRGLAAVGRTALSNYLMTSLGAVLLQEGPWKLYGNLSTTRMFMLWDVCGHQHYASLICCDSFPLVP